MALTKEQVIILQKGGFTKAQISTVSSSIEKARLSTAKATKIINMLVKNPKFKKEFFEDPLIAVQRAVAM